MLMTVAASIVGFLFVANVVDAYILWSVTRSIHPLPPWQRFDPPTGEGWQFEVKFDGFRVQLHKVGLAAALFVKKWQRPDNTFSGDRSGGHHAAGAVTHY